MVTGSIELWQIPELRPMSNVFGPYARTSADTENDKDFKKYFTELGYKITSDFHVRSGQVWWELYDGDAMAAQIDKDVPLKDLLEDLCQFHLGKEGTSKSDYTVSGEGKHFQAFLKKVYENCHNGPSN